MSALGLLAAGAALYYGSRIFAAKDLPKDLQIQIDVQKITIVNWRPVMELKIQLTNPGRANLKINSLGGTISFKNSTIGTFSDLSPWTIKPRSIVSRVIPVTFNTGAIVQLFITGIRGSRQIDLAGKLYTDLGAVPFNQSIKA